MRARSAVKTPFRRNNSCFLAVPDSNRDRDLFEGKNDMPVAPEHYRAARLPLPRLPLPAILGFAVTGLGGALFLAYSTFSAPETSHSLASASAAPVYEARAPPSRFQTGRGCRARGLPSPGRLLPRAAKRSRPSAAKRSGKGMENPSSRFFWLTPMANCEVSAVSRIPASRIAISPLTGGTFGMSAQMAPAGFFAPEAETIISAPVPEASTWICGAALLVLVVARGLYASWYRHQRRSASKSDLAH